MLLGGVCLSFAQDVDYTSYFKTKAHDLHGEAVNLRRQLHRFPEPCYREKETSAFAIAYLEKLGLEIHKGIAGYGFKAVLKGHKASPVFAIRTDMDALPIQEKTALPFSSKNKGFMHACGHDAHMTNVLIAARMLVEIREQIPGTVVFVFQPCEEGPPAGQKGGAEAMIDGGVLENPKVDAIISLHVMPDLPLGKVGIKEGPIMANVASFDITLFGKSSHGAFPHQGIDAIYAAATAIQEFQALVSRFRDPMEPAVLTVGKISGGVRRNVIAEKVIMEGTVRTFSFDFQDRISMGIEKILKGMGISQGIKYRYDFRKDAPFVKNDPALTGFLRPVFEKVAGEGNVLTVKPQTVAEDFSHYSHRIPAVLFLMGVGGSAALHTPDFAVDEEVFKVAPAIFASAAIYYLKDYSQR